MINYEVIFDKTSEILFFLTQHLYLSNFSLPLLESLDDNVDSIVVIDCFKIAGEGFPRLHVILKFFVVQGYIFLEWSSD